MDTVHSIIQLHMWYDFYKILIYEEWCDWYDLFSLQAGPDKMAASNSTFTLDQLKFITRKYGQKKVVPRLDVHLDWSSWGKTLDKCRDFHRSIESSRDWKRRHLLGWVPGTPFQIYLEGGNKDLWKNSFPSPLVFSPRIWSTSFFVLINFVKKIY